ncbi:MAG: PD40 domain-containing protein [Bacteroidetes bacterium]|nr:PD40 domain-containing protein [Bacteroidota bacterium]
MTKKLLFTLVFLSLALVVSVLVFNYGGLTKSVEVVWSEPVQITKGIEVNSVQFFIDGRLLFVSNDGILMANADGTDMRTLFYYEGVRRANISPDGEKIVFDNDFDIFIANPDGSELEPIANGLDIFEFAVSFTPDGKAITFVTIDDVKSTYGIWKMDPDGGNKINLILSNDLIFRHPRQSPDGRRISYFSTGKGKKPNIWVMDKNGKNSVTLTNPDVDVASRQASWSPDGKKLVYSSKKSGDFDIWTMDTDGGNKTQVTSVPGDETKPVWSPNGKSITFICSNCRDTAGSDLYIISRK